jgi:hypothetical protein
MMSRHLGELDYDEFRTLIDSVIDWLQVHDVAGSIATDYSVYGVLDDVYERAVKRRRAALTAGVKRMKFRKKPVVIEAHRLGDDGWPDAIWDGVNTNQIVLHLGRDGAKRVIGYAEIHTMEGTMRADIGDYIIRGVKGEFYPCKPDIFEATYEAVLEPPQPLFRARAVPAMPPPSEQK